MGLRPVQALMMAPVALFLGTLAAMLLRPPDVPFYEIDRVAFVLLVARGGGTSSHDSGSGCSLPSERLGR